MSFSGEEMFEGGTLVGANNAVSRNGELIIMEASGVAPEGFYVLLQKDNDGLNEQDWLLHIAGFMVFGEYTATITGCPYHIRLYPFSTKQTNMARGTSDPGY